MRRSLIAATMIPVLNEAGVPQISPANTAVGLTTDDPGATPGEPDKYYPSGERNYGRVVPIDTIQGAAQAQYMKDEGVTNVYRLPLEKALELARRDPMVLAGRLVIEGARWMTAEGAARFGSEQ